MDMSRSLLDMLLSIMEDIIYIICTIPYHACSQLSAWYGKSGIGLYREIVVILLRYVMHSYW